MFQLTINEKGGQPIAQSFDKNEITIGRVQGNDVVLPKGNISKRHSRIVLKDGKFIIVDLKSTNGTYVNGKKITAPQVIKATDKIYIGDYTIQLSNGGGAAVAPEIREPSSRPPRSGAKEEIDLFGGEPVSEAGSPVPAPKPGAPGLIDDNFDQEFEVSAEAPKKEAPKPSIAKSKLPAPKPPPEPEPSGPDESEAELDLSADFGGAAEPEPGDEPSVDPEPPKAPVVPMKPPPKKVPPAALPARSQPSRLRPPTAQARSKPSPSEDDVEGGLGFEPAEVPASTPTPSPPAMRSPPPAASMVPVLVPPPAAPTSSVAASPPSGGFSVDRSEAIRALHLAVVEDLGLRGYDLAALSSMRDRTLALARTHAQRMQAAGRLDSSEDLDQIARTVASLALDMDLIGGLLGDDEVVQIIVTHDRQLWSERDALKPEGQFISSEDQVVDLIRRLGVLGGADPSPKNPLVDVRLRDGSRVIGCLPPLAFRGPTLSIRKASRDAYDLESLVEAGTMSSAMMKLIDFCLRNKKSMLISLGPGVTGSATLNAIASHMADDERVVTIESGVELHLGSLKNVTALEPTRDLGLSELVRHAASLQPDRAIIGNIHGLAVFDVLTAVAGPLDGSICSYSASSPIQALERLAYVELGRLFPTTPLAAKRLVASAFPVILQEERFPEGSSRRITRVSELFIEGEDVHVQDVFVFRPEGVDGSGVLTGTFSATGHEPRFVQELVDRGDEIDMDIFKE